jgi:hypothetical protein
VSVASQRVFVVVSVYFVIDSFRKLLDTPPYAYREENTSKEIKLLKLPFEFLLWCEVF